MTVSLQDQLRDPYAAIEKKEVLFSICPTPVASHIALDLGWLDEEINRAGGKLTYLRSIADVEQAWPHVGHRSDSLIRDGGNSPPIWARADISDTKLVAITFVGESGGQLLVRTDSDLHRPADLKGRKIGIVKGLNTAKVDFLRAPAERGVELVLALAGLTRADVEIVDIANDDRTVEEPSRSPAERLTRIGRAGSERSPDVQALSEGKIDAIFARGGKTQFLEQSGEFRVLEDLGRYPDWTLRANNTPYVTTVSSELAEAYPELVVAFLRATIRAGRWINANRRSAAEIFNRTAARYPSLDAYETSLGKHDFEPNLSPQAIKGVEIEKNFLLSHGYIQKDFDINDWVDARFLNEAKESLDSGKA
jgi:ABC-type nitrate/sulfonate/bicarbonate transport system substrate-binding protein